MALIKQIKVGGTIYDIAMSAGSGIEVSTSGVVSARLASGLFFNGKGEITPLFATVASGLVIDEDVARVKVGSGLSVDDSNGVTLKIGSGFTFDNYGRLTIA